MDDEVTTAVETVRVAIDAKLADAHQAIGRMLASATAGEFETAVDRFLSVTRDMSVVIARVEARSDPRADRLLEPVRAHPLHREPLKLAPRIARGTRDPLRTRPDDFYFQSHADAPAITMCADYLDKVSTLLERVKRRRY
jgi:hypothetical protein